MPGKYAIKTLCQSIKEKKRKKEKRRWREPAGPPSY
jgi:hypothetical protein